MNFKELYEKYQELIDENNNLKEEIKELRTQLDITKPRFNSNEIFEHKSTLEIFTINTPNEALLINTNSFLEPPEKIKLFMSLFRGRGDVYAKRWQNKKGQAGYSPVCLNEWKPRVCHKPKLKCIECNQKAYAALDEKVIEEHLRGNIVAGIFPMCLDETCYFLAIDFDDEGWQKDISVLRNICNDFDIPVSVERSRSGRGAHAWFFFEDRIPSVLARKFGSALLTCSMIKRHEITFKSYDRFFPNQDTLPKGGLGNLIALPLQKAARNANNSEFIDENFEPYHDQWAFLGNIKKISEERIKTLICKLCHGNELGLLRKDDEEEPKPWEQNKVTLLKSDFPNNIEFIKANMLFIPKTGISQRALNHLKRLAAFKNPEFYKAQSMRISTYNKPRIISCAYETEKYLCLPRGCESDLTAIFKKLDLDFILIDKTNAGKSINVEFNGSLRDEQPYALNELLKFDNGVLSGTTAFGKTVVAIKLISERKVW